MTRRSEGTTPTAIEKYWAICRRCGAHYPLEANGHGERPGPAWRRGRLFPRSRLSRVMRYELFGRTEPMGGMICGDCYLNHLESIEEREE